MEQALNNAKVRIFVSSSRLCRLLIVHLQADQDKLLGIQLTYRAQLADPELVFRSISFVNFVSTWIIRFVDPKRTHPNPLVESVKHPRTSRVTVQLTWITLDSPYPKKYP